MCELEEFFRHGGYKKRAFDHGRNPGRKQSGSKPSHSASRAAVRVRLAGVCGPWALRGLPNDRPEAPRDRTSWSNTDHRNFPTSSLRAFASRLLPPRQNAIFRTNPCLPQLRLLPRRQRPPRPVEAWVLPAQAPQPRRHRCPRQGRRRPTLPAPEQRPAVAFPLRPCPPRPQLRVPPRPHRPLQPSTPAGAPANRSAPVRRTLTASPPDRLPLFFSQRPASFPQRAVPSSSAFDQPRHLTTTCCAIVECFGTLSSLCNLPPPRNVLCHRRVLSTNLGTVRPTCCVIVACFQLPCQRPATFPQRALPSSSAFDQPR